MPRAHRIANPKPIPGFQYRYIRDFLSQAFAPLGFIRFRAVSQGLGLSKHRGAPKKSYPRNPLTISRHDVSHTYNVNETIILGLLAEIAGLAVDQAPCPRWPLVSRGKLGKSPRLRDHFCSSFHP